MISDPLCWPNIVIRNGHEDLMKYCCNLSVKTRQHHTCTCIFMATSRPSRRVARCTWPILAAANGWSSNDENLSRQSTPNSLFKIFCKHGMHTLGIHYNFFLSPRTRTNRIIIMKKWWIWYGGARLIKYTVFPNFKRWSSYRNRAREDMLQT